MNERCEATLLEAQRAFAAALRSKADVAALALLVGDEARNRQLLALYRGNAIANAGKALGLCYPVIERIVGDEFFGGLCRAFWSASPSCAGDLNEYGEGFAAFLSSFPHVSDMPYLPDVARLEWLVSCAARAADHVAADIASLAHVAPDEVGALHLHLQPALRLLSSPWPVATIWLQHQATYQRDIDVDIDQENAECIVVYRHGMRVEVASLAAGDAALWRAAAAGLPLADKLAAAFAADEMFDVQAALQAGFSKGFITSLGLGAS